MTKVTIDPINISNAEAFCYTWERYQETRQYPADHIINADETLLHVCKDGAQPECLEVKYKEGGSDFLDDAASIGSMTLFVSAAGTIWLLVFCLKIPKLKKGNEA